MIDPQNNGQYKQKVKITVWQRIRMYFERLANEVNKEPGNKNF